MKKNLFEILLAVALWGVATTCSALTWYWVDTTDVETNLHAGTNVVTIGDPLWKAFGEINSNFCNVTSPPVFYATGLSNGAQPTVTATNVGSSIAAYILGVPAGAPGTNTVTQLVFTNSLLTSDQITWYQTNAFSFSSSNFVLRVSNYYGASVIGPQFVKATDPNGGPIYGASTVNLWGSYSGTNGWFSVTNGFFTSNAISISCTCSNSGVGFMALYGDDQPQTWGRTNSFWGQSIRLGTPANPNDIAIKSYVDNAVAAAFPTTWQIVNTNGTHLEYFALGAVVQDLAYNIQFSALSPCTLDGTGTNITFSTGVTNLLTGWQLLTTTNLLTTWVVASGFATNDAAGLCTFTVPINPNVQASFYGVARIVTTANNLDSQVNANVGVAYPSNTFSLFTVTNGMGPEAFWLGYSNHNLVSIYLSNGVVRMTHVAP